MINGLDVYLVCVHWVKCESWYNITVFGVHKTLAISQIVIEYIAWGDLTA